MKHRPSLHRRHQNGGDATPAPRGDGVPVAIEPDSLGRVFMVPAWLRNLGSMSWFAVGVLVLIGGVVWLLSITATIVVPVLTASIIAAVLSPVVSWLAGHGVGRGGGAAIVLLAVLAAGIGVVVLLLSGVTSETVSLQKSLHSAVERLQGWLTDAGVSPSKAKSAAQDSSASLSDAFHTLLNGVGHGISALASLAAFLSFTLLS